MSFFEELKRRNVFRIGIAYLIGAWLLLQVADVVPENMHALDLLDQAIEIDPELAVAVCLRSHY